MHEAQNVAFALLGLYSACHADWITFASLDQTPSLVNHPNNTNQFGMFSCTVEYSPIYCRACLQRLRSTVTPLSPYLFFSETKLVFLACLIKIKVQIFRIKLNALTKHEAVNSSLLWNKIRPCSSTEIISPTLRLLEIRKTYCFRWQPWITRVHDEEFNTLVIYPVPSFQIDAVGN